MKRLGQWLFNFAVALSLVLWLVATVAWPISYWWAIGINHILYHSSVMSVSVNTGDLNLDYSLLMGKVRNDHWEVWPPDNDFSLLSVGFDENGFHALGFVWNSGSGWSHRVGIPLWFLSLLLAWPIIHMMKQRLRSNLPLYHCKQCGYDLRATPDQCPECGTVPTKEPQGK